MKPSEVKIGQTFVHRFGSPWSTANMDGVTEFVLRGHITQVDEHHATFQYDSVVSVTNVCPGVPLQVPPGGGVVLAMINHPKTRFTFDADVSVQPFI